MNVSTSYSPSNFYQQSNVNDKKQSESTNTFLDYLSTEEKKETDKPTKIDSSDQQATFTYTKEDFIASSESEYTPKNPESAIFLNQLEKKEPNLFKNIGMSAEDEQMCRDILADNEIKDDEIKNLSYEQAETFYSFFSSHIFKYKDEVQLPKPLGESITLLATTKELGTNDETFNKALFKSMKEVVNHEDMLAHFGEYQANLAQVAYGQELKGTYISGAFTKPMEDPFLYQQDFNIDYDHFFTDVLNYYNSELNKNKEDVTQNQIKAIIGFYEIIQDNYNEEKSYIER